MTATSTALPKEAAPSPALAPPPGNPRFALFDSLRGLAAVCILVFHVSAVTGLLLKPVVGDAIVVLGPNSLILFFAISGFLLYRPFAAGTAGIGRSPGVPRYLRRRVLRIVPAYWVALTVLAIFPGIVGVFTEDWWRYYFFLQLYSSETLAGGIPVAWSLCVDFCRRRRHTNAGTRRAPSTHCWCHSSKHSNAHNRKLWSRSPARCSRTSSSTTSGRK